MDYVITGINARRMLRSLRASRSDLTPLSWQNSVGRIASGAYTPLTEADCTRLGMLGTPTKRHPLKIIVPCAGKRIRWHDEMDCQVIASILPGRPFLKASAGYCIAGPELLFIDAASTMDFASLLLFGMELCGTYTFRSSYPESTTPVYQVEPATTAAKIASVIDGCSGARIRGTREAGLAARFLMDNAASPMESVLALMLRLPRSRGGAGLGVPILNRIVPVEDELRHLTEKRYFEPDVYLEDCAIDVEYESEEFHPEIGHWDELDATSREAIEKKQQKDKQRMRLIQTMGIRVFQTTYDDFKDDEAFDSYLEQLLRQMKDHAGADWEARWAKLRKKDAKARRSALLGSLLRGGPA